MVFIPPSYGDNWGMVQMTLLVHKSTWWFPEMGVPPNHPFIDPYKPIILGYIHLYIDRFSLINQLFWGTPICGDDWGMVSDIVLPK